MVGLTRSFTYEALTAAVTAVRGGARFIGTNEDATYPTPEALLALLNDSATALDTSLSALTPEALAAPAPPGPPSQDGKVSGFIGVLAWHETYHVGQIAYLRSWLGLSGVFG